MINSASTITPFSFFDFKNNNPVLFWGLSALVATNITIIGSLLTQKTKSNLNDNETILELHHTLRNTQQELEDNKKLNYQLACNCKTLQQSVCSLQKETNLHKALLTQTYTPLSLHHCLQNELHILTQQTINASQKLTRLEHATATSIGTLQEQLQTFGNEQLVQQYQQELEQLRAQIEAISQVLPRNEQGLFVTVARNNSYLKNIGSKDSLDQDT
tara:strand:+ start:761 stop:1408 length:648 start_codon:yes stop_codon:yes gene_type:complete